MSSEFTTFFRKKIIKPLSSLKLAVFIILSLAVISAVGTIVEARFDATYAQKMVYQSIWMYLVLGLLCVVLTAVMVDRWPWKRRHTGFVLAHIGIIMLLFGSWLTQKYGIDGSMAFAIGDKGRLVSVPENEILLYSTFEGANYSLIHGQSVDFIRNPPSKERPVVIQLGSEQLKIVDFMPFAFRKERVVASKASATKGGAMTPPSNGPAIRFQIMNDRVNVSNWLLLGASKSFDSINLGPARVVISDGSYKYSNGNEIVVHWDKGKSKVAYAIYSKKSGGLQAKGFADAGDTIKTGWMGLEFRILKFIPSAERLVEYEAKDRPTPLTTAALQFEYNGARHWVGLNSVYRLFAKDSMYLLSYGNRRIDIGFDLTLKKFEVGRYQGTMRAASYQSLVDVPGLGDYLIAMNEPLKHNGFTFYQASFEQDEQGRPTASILSVNRDPGRPMKYLGSILIVLGSSILFWFRRAKIFK